MPSILKDAKIDAISIVDKGANLKKIFLFKRADDASPVEEVESEQSLNMVLPLIKGFGMQGAPPDSWDVFYCVVAVPDEVDQQGDIWSADEIRKAAHDYVEGGGLINLMHKTMEPVGKLVESAIALTDMTVNGEVIKRGSWYIAVRPNPDMKSLIEKGELTGVSVQGSAKREPVFTPGIDSPGTMLHTVAKSSVRTLDGKAVKEGQVVHLAADPSKSYIVLGEHPQSGRLVIGNVSGETLEIDSLDLLTPQTAQAKLEQAQAAAQPAPMQLQYGPQPGQSPFAAVYEQAEAAQQEQQEQQEQQVVGKAGVGHATLDGAPGVWRTIRGARVFVATEGDKAGTVIAGPDEIRGISLEGLTKRTELLPSQFEAPIAKDARGRQLHRGDYVSHIMDPSRSMPVVEILPQGVVVEVEKDGAPVPAQSIVSPRQLMTSTGPIGGKGGLEDLVNALIGDFDENESLRAALARYGVHSKEQIEPAVQSRQLTEAIVRELIKLVDGPADSGDDRNVEGTVAVGQGRAASVYKSSSGQVLDIDAMVQALNEVPDTTAEVDAMAEETEVEKAVPQHPADKCAVGGCDNCITDGEEVVKQGCGCDCPKCADGECGCTKGTECKTCTVVVEKGDKPFPGAAPPFKRKKKHPVGLVDEKGDQKLDEHGNQYEDADLRGLIKDDRAEGMQAEADAAAEQARDSLRRRRRLGEAGDPVEVEKHFKLGVPHDHPHDEGAVAPKKPRLRGEPAPAEMPEPTEKAGFPPTRTPNQPMGGKQPTTPGALDKPEANGQQPPQPPAPKKPQLNPEQKAKIIAELMQVAASGDQQLLGFLREMGVQSPEQLPQVLESMDDEMVMSLAAKFLQGGRTSQTPPTQGHGLGVSAAKAGELVDRMTKAAVVKHGYPAPEQPGPDAPKRRLPAPGVNVVKGQGSRLQLDGTVVKQGGDVTPGKLFVGPDGKRYIARAVSDTTVVGFAGGQEVRFPRGQVRMTKQSFAKRGGKAGDRLPFPEGLLAENEGEKAELTTGALVEVPGKAIGEVRHVEEDGTVVVTVDQDGMPRRREYKRTQVTLVKAAVKQGDAVILPDGSAGEVEAVEGSQVVVVTVGKDLKEKRQKYGITEVRTVGGSTPIEKTPPRPGSMHGHHPKKHGKIRHIVRAFGRWAGGKHGVCVARLRAEHPEVAKGRENQLCAWLKDQWAGTTHWRQGRQGVVKDSATLEVDVDLDPDFEPTDAELDSLFEQFCEFYGHDQDELLAKFEELGVEGIDAYLDELFGSDDEADSENVAENASVSGSESATLATDDSSESSRDGEAVTGLDRVRGVFKRALGIQLSKEAPTARETNFLAAVESLTEQLVVAAGEDDEGLRKRQSEQVINDFGRWFDEFSSLRA